MFFHLQNTLTKWTFWVVVTIAVATVGFIAGCGSHSSNVNTTGVLSTGFKQVGATYVSSLTCRNCHANIYADYANQKDITPPEDTLLTPLPGMGSSLSNLPVSNPTNPMLPTAANHCNACHITGYGDSTGFKFDGSTPQLDGIGCEDCHGPGSKHVAASTNADRIANITRVPTANKTCWSCHGDFIVNPDGTHAPGAIYLPATSVTDATLHNQGPNQRGPHHAAAAFLLGRDGFNITTPMPSPHTQLPNTCLNCHKPVVNPASDPVNPGEVRHGAMAFLPPNLDRTRPECVSCHGGRITNYTTIQQGVLAKLIQLGGPSGADPTQADSNAVGGLLGAYATAHPQIDVAGNTNTAPDDPAVMAYKAARYSFNYVRGEGSFGVHNPQFADRLLTDAIARLASTP